MHIKRLEEYSFSHGLHRDNSTGKFLPLQPHKVGRPLTHEEMDYNMLYMEQTLGGYKIFGSNADTTLSEDDLDKSLILHRITPASEDYARYTSDGYFSDNEFIWIPDCCGDGSGGGSAQPCNINVTASSNGQASSGLDDAEIIVFVTGLQGAPSFSINGDVVTPNSVNGTQYIFAGYGAGTYTIIVTDTGISDYVCNDTATITITEEVDNCAGFALTLTAQNSGADEDPAVCELEGLTVLQYTSSVEFGASNGTATLEVSGSYTGPLSWIIRKDGVTQSITPTENTSTLFSLSGLSAGDWTIFVIDTAVPGGTCDEFAAFTIDSGGDPCVDFAITLTSQNSGQE